MDRSVATVALAYAVLCGALLWFAAPVGLVGLTLDRDLAILAGSTMPSPSLRVGDRVIEVQGQPVGSAAELSAVLARLPSAETSVTIERRDRMQRVTLSELRFRRDPPADLLTAHRLVSIDGRPVADGIPISELEGFLADAAPTPIVVEYELERTPLRGTISVKPRSHSPLVLAWLGLGALAMLAIGLLSAARLTRRRDSMPMVVAGLGGLALSALTALLVTDGCAPSFSLGAVTLFALWRGFTLRTSDDDGPGGSVGMLVVAPAFVLGAGALYVAVTSVAQETVGGWLAHLRQATVVGGVVGIAYLVVWVLRARSTSPAAARIAGAILLAGIALGSILGATGAVGVHDAVLWTLLVSGAGAWVVDIRAQLAGSVPMRGRAQAVSGVGLEEALIAVQAVLPEGFHAEAVGGVDETWVRVRREERGSSFELATVAASEEIGGGFGMLALEGGMFPRHTRMHGSDVVEDDPFADFGSRLGIVAAFPAGGQGTRAGVAGFFAVFSEEAAESGLASAVVDLEAVLEAVQDVDSPRVAHELVALVSQSMLRTARRAGKRALKSAPAAKPPAVPSEAKRGSEKGGATQGASVAGEAWSRQLAEELKRGYPVDDPDALDDREWMALGFLRESIKPALLVGEPGVGKEFVARAVHEAMWGDERRFAVLDCAVRPASIVEIELFGDEETTGLVELVGSGTLLIKGASSLGESRLAQLVARLLRAKARIVFAERYTGAEPGVPKSVPPSIRGAVEDRNIHFSPLRDRPDDIVRYARYFLHRAGMTYDAMVTDVDQSAEQWLRALTLPTNFHELKALVASAALRARSEVVTVGDFQVGPKPAAPRAQPTFGDGAAETTGDTPARSASASVDASSNALASAPQPAPKPSSEPMEDDGWTDEERAERTAIADALEEFDGNRTHAAEALDMSRGALLRRMRKYEIS